MSVHKQAFVPSCEIKFYLPGEDCLTSKPADMILVRHMTGSWASRLPGVLIRFGGWLRKSSRPYAWTDHAMTVLTGGANPMVVQETNKGCVLTPLVGPPSIGAFTEDLYCVISPTVATKAQRDASVAFIQWTLGSGYGWWSLPIDAFDDVTGLRVALSTSVRMVCSANASRAAERWGLIPDRSSEAVTPPNLAQYFNCSTKDTMQMYHQFLQQKKEQQ